MEGFPKFMGCNSLHRESLNRKYFAFLKSVQSRSNFPLKHVGVLFTLLVTKEVLQCVLIKFR